MATNGKSTDVYSITHSMNDMNVIEPLSSEIILSTQSTPGGTAASEDTSPVVKKVKKRENKEEHHSSHDSSQDSDFKEDPIKFKTSTSKDESGSKHKKKIDRDFVKRSPRKPKGVDHCYDSEIILKSRDECHDSTDHRDRDESNETSTKRVSRWDSREPKQRPSRWDVCEPTKPEKKDHFESKNHDSKSDSDHRHDPFQSHDFSYSNKRNRLNESREGEHHDDTKSSSLSPKEEDTKSPVKFHRGYGGNSRIQRGGGWGRGRGGYHNTNPNSTDSYQQRGGGWGRGRGGYHNTNPNSTDSYQQRGRGWGRGRGGYHNTNPNSTDSYQQRGRGWGRGRGGYHDQQRREERWRREEVQEERSSFRSPNERRMERRRDKETSPTHYYQHHSEERSPSYSSYKGGRRTPRSGDSRMRSPKKNPLENYIPKYSRQVLPPFIIDAKWTYQEIEGDLFDSPLTASLAHCVSQDLHMGKGIATIFKEKFQRVEELKSQGVVPGGVAILKDNERYIYYLVTKYRYYHKPTNGTIYDSLYEMKLHIIENDVKELNMPLIGCGLDQLDWTDVSQMLTELFHDVPITVTIYRPYCHGYALP